MCKKNKCYPKILVSTLIIIVFTIKIASAQNETYWKFDTIDAPSLKGNLLEDEASRLIEVYLPPSYHKSNKKYPVIYYLSSYNGRGKKQNYKVKKYKKLIDNKIHSNQLNEVIFVLVSGSNRLRGSFYINSPVTGNWEDFVTKDLVNYMDANYRTISSREARSLTGNSMGGSGVIHLSMKHPDIFGASYCISPGAHKDNGFADSQVLYIENNIENTISVIEKFNAFPKEQAHNEFMNFLDTLTNRTLFFTMAYGVAHSPNPDKAPYFNFPYKVVGNDTIVDQEIWQQWQDGFGGLDWKIERYSNNLKQLKVFGIACGYNDNYKWIYEGCCYLAEKLTQQQINHVFYLHEGTHGSRTTEVLMNHAIPILTNAMIHE